MDGVGPPRAQAREHQPRVGYRPHKTDRGAKSGQPEPFDQERSSDGLGRKPGGQEQPNLGGTALDAESKEQYDEHSRRADQEETEPDEQAAEVGTAVARLNGVPTNRFKAQTEMPRVKTKSQRARKPLG